ncbi:hypothetical protein VIGAN_06086300 [Vigna angularis var. angularis]|uniref:Uncharacterized protein n=1 Tax=Vigna angularis var. angularis TaxID=157739 RepID=A0A0S3SAH4_PHAAN|nr:hypothetical protein VIGAN_06086300 [Vigna angularis var. angularis]
MKHHGPRKEKVFDGIKTQQQRAQHPAPLLDPALGPRCGVQLPLVEKKKEDCSTGELSVFPARKWYTGISFFWFSLLLEIRRLF